MQHDGFNDQASILTHSREAEQMVIGALLIDGNKFDEVDALVSEGDFFEMQHRHIYRAMVALHSSRQPLDIMTVSNWMEQHGAAVEGLFTYLYEVQQNTPSSAYVKRYAEIVASYGQQRAMLDALDKATREVVAPGKPIAERIDVAQELVMGVAEAKAGYEPRHISAIMQDCINELDRRYSGDGDIHGLRTGFIDFDKLTGGLKPGNLVIVAGRPSMGKSTFAFNIGEQVGRDHGVVLAFSLEMGDTEQGFRTIASQGGIHADRLASGRFSDADWEGLSKAAAIGAQMKFFIDERSRVTVSDIRITARKLKKKEGLALIVLDYLGLMVRNADRANAELTDISRELKLLAKELEVPVIALAQLNRGVEARTDKRPLLSDLRDSGAIEQDADLVVMMYRDEYYYPDSQFKGMGEAIIRKQRNGPLGTVPLVFEGHHSRYRNADWNEWSERREQAEAPKPPQRPSGFAGRRGVQA